MFSAQRTHAAWQRRRLAFTTALVLSLLVCPRWASAAYNDTVVLKNGDTLKGEVKGLQQGKLQFKTDTMSTVYIKWDRVAQITAPESFEVEMTDGSRFFGSLEPAADGKLGLGVGGPAVLVDLADVVKITPIKQRFWDRLDGSIDLGASYTKSTGIGQGSLSVAVGTRRRNFEVSTTFDTTITVQPEEPVASRTVLSLGYVQLLRNRWFVPGLGKFERNTDLGLDLRSSVSVGFGRFLVQTNRTLFGASGGLVVNQEIPVEGDKSENVEAFANVSYSFFTYDTPKTNITTSFTVFPSLNVAGRVRTDVDIALKRELLKDFTVGLTIWDMYDSKAPSGSSSTHDFGATVSIGWTF